jgi:hypothetical protein
MPKNRSRTVITTVTKKKTPPKKKASKTSRKKSKRGPKSGPKNALTPDGNAFLKCITSPCDFLAGSTGFQGIPDEYDNRVIVDECRSVNGLPTYTPGNDLYIIQPPIPGVAYMWGQVAGGTRGQSTAIQFTPVWYSNVSTMYPSYGAGLTVVDKFRVASNAIELVNTTNDMTWAGSIEAFKLDLSYDRLLDPFVDVSTHQKYLEVPVLMGFSGLYTSEPGYVNKISEGVYMTAFNQQASYPFQPVQFNSALSELSANMANLPSGDTSSLMTIATVSPDIFPGFGSLETNVIRIPAIATGQSMRIRTWSCVEYTVPSTSILWHFTHLSPPSDMMALALLKEFHHQFPIAVTAAQNASFWENVRKWVQRVTKLGSNVPGPIGQISHLVNGLVKTGELGFSLDD